MTGRSHGAYGEEFPFTDSEYADETAALFDSRESLQTNAPLLLKHFSRFGMELHKGNLPAEKESKTAPKSRKCMQILSLLMMQI